MVDSKLRIAVDEREKPSGVPDALSDMGVRIDFDLLEVGDYVLSSDIAVERKSVGDLLSSIFDGRLFKQCRDLSERFSKPLLVVEGNLLQLRDMTRNPRVVYGALASVTANTSARLFISHSPEETATFLYFLTRHVNSEPSHGPLLDKKRKATSTRGIQLNVVSSLPGVGYTLAERLLAEFKTPKKVFSSSASDMARVKGMGNARARKIQDVLRQPFSSQQEEDSQATLSEE
ncbi:MAG: heavy metal resistance protein CzcA [Thaumarchaeota archaeon]|nr:heavy metal resistance protein CzcA [Nitrososphaerota archaeon]